MLSQSTLKDAFVHAVLGDILSGRYTVGQRLPAEREFAKLMNISRTVVRSGIAELAAKGVIKILPRQGSVVADFRTNGTISIVNAMLTEGFEFFHELLNDFIAARYLFECETASLAAELRTKDELTALFGALQDETEYCGTSSHQIAVLTFAFHKAVVAASHNLFYSIIINSMENTYVQCLVRNYNAGVSFSEVKRRHAELFEAIRLKDPPLAKKKMKYVLDCRV